MNTIQTQTNNTDDTPIDWLFIHNENLYYHLTGVRAFYNNGNFDQLVDCYMNLHHGLDEKLSIKNLNDDFESLFTGLYDVLHNMKKYDSKNLKHYKKLLLIINNRKPDGVINRNPQYILACYYMIVGKIDSYICDNLSFFDFHKIDNGNYRQIGFQYDVY